MSGYPSYGAQATPVGSYGAGGGNVYGAQTTAPASVAPQAHVRPVLDDFEKRYTLNETFQRLVEKPINSFEEAKERYAEIEQHSTVLSEKAKSIVKTIVDEMSLDDGKKTYHAMAGTRGIAGGVKFMESQLFIKFAIDHMGVYGGDTAASAKTAGHELKGLSAILSCNIPDLHFALLCIIGYRGFRAVVYSEAPIDDSTLRYGTSDAGKTFQSMSPELRSMMYLVAQKLNLKPHVPKCTTEEIPLAVDLEGHQGFDGRYYVADFARLLPPETAVPGITGCTLYRLLRPEFVQQYAHPLSSDAFSGFVDIEEDNVTARAATSYLHDVIVPQLASVFPSVVEAKLTDQVFTEQDVANLKVTIHKQGVNIRHMGLLLYHVTKTHGLDRPASHILAVEIVARASKSVMLDIMRREKLHEKATMKSCAEFLNQILVQGLLGVDFNHHLKKMFATHVHCTAQADRDAVNKLILNDNYLFDVAQKNKLILLGRICTMTGLKIKADKLKGWNPQHPTPIDATFIEEIQTIVKHINVIPIAEVLRTEGKFPEAEQYYKHALAMRKQIVGKDSVQVAITLTHMAELYSDMGSKDMNAEQCYTKAIKIYKVKRPDSLDLALAKERLGLFYLKSARYAEAERRLNSAFELKKQHNAPPYEVASTLEHLAWSFHAQEKYQEALDYYAQALKIQTDSANELDIPRTLNNMGQTLVALGQIDQAKDLYNKLYKLLQENHSENSHIAIALDNRAKLYADDPATFKEAEEAFRQALAIKIKTLGEKHAETGITQDHLAQLLVKTGQLQEAEELFKSALATLRARLHNRHFAIGITLHNIAALYAKRSDWHLACEAEEEALTIFNLTLGPAHHLTETADSSLKELRAKYRRPAAEKITKALAHEGIVSSPAALPKAKERLTKSLLEPLKTEKNDALLKSMISAISQLKDDGAFQQGKRQRISKSDTALAELKKQQSLRNSDDMGSTRSPAQQFTRRNSAKESGVSRAKYNFAMDNVLHQRPWFTFPDIPQKVQTLKRLQQQQQREVQPEPVHITTTDQKQFLRRNSSLLTFSVEFLSSLANHLSTSTMPTGSMDFLCNLAESIQAPPPATAPSNPFAPQRSFTRTNSKPSALLERRAPSAATLTVPVKKDLLRVSTEFTPDVAAEILKGLTPPSTPPTPAERAVRFNLEVPETTTITVTPDNVTYYEHPEEHYDEDDEDAEDLSESGSLRSSSEDPLTDDDIDDVLDELSGDDLQKHLENLLDEFGDLTEEELQRVMELAQGVMLQHKIAAASTPQEEAAE